MSQEASGLPVVEELMHWKGIPADSVGLGLPFLLLYIAKNIKTFILELETKLDPWLRDD